MLPQVYEEIEKRKQKKPSAVCTQTSILHLHLDL